MNSFYYASKFKINCFFLEGGGGGEGGPVLGNYFYKNSRSKKKLLFFFGGGRGVWGRGVEEVNFFHKDSNTHLKKNLVFFLFFLGGGVGGEEVKGYGG